jgi:membrane associated rhomboid family serine protease
LNILKDIKEHITTTNIVEKTIYLNIAIFLLVAFFSSFMISNFSLSANINLLMERPWSIFTYAFVHVRFIHLLSNLIVLYYIGHLFLDFFSIKRFIIYYVSGILIGGLFFIAYYELLNKTSSFPLGGASAAVMAVLVGVATKVPHYSLKLRFIGSVELWVLAVIWVVISAFGAVGVNSGSALSHLGGASIGFLLTTYFKEGAVLESLFNKKTKKTPFQKVYKTNKSSLKTQPSYSKKKQNQRKVDLILDKISKSGYEALSKEEKDFLFNQKED